ncbi:MAG: hypothetical protein Kow0059_07860 [Candidatus Sumerlaeia bacterium]
MSKHLRGVGLTALMAVVVLGGMLNVQAAGTIRTFVRDFGDPADRSDDTLHSAKIVWDKDDLPLRVVVFRDFTQNIIFPGNNLNNVSNTDIINGLQRALARWSDVDYSDFEFSQGFTFSDFWAGFLPFQRGGPSFAALDRFNLISFQEPNVLIGDATLAITSIWYVDQDTDLTDPAVIEAGDFQIVTQNGDAAGLIVILDQNGDGIIDILLPYRKLKAGTILDTDIIMNQTTLDWNQYGEDPPDDEETLQAALGTLDIEAVLMRELGHSMGLANSQLFNPVMTGQGYRTTGDFLANPWDMRELKLDDEIAAGIGYPSGAFKSSGGISGSVIDGAAVTQSSAVDFPVTQIPVFFGNRRFDLGLDITKYDLDTIRLTREGPVQLRAHVITGFDISIADGPNSPLVLDPLPSDYIIRGLEPRPDWVVYTTNLNINYDSIAAQFAGSENVPAEFFGGATPPIPGDGRGIDPANNTDLIFGNSYLQVSVNNQMQFMPKVTNGPELMDGVFDPIATSSYATVRIVRPGQPNPDDFVNNPQFTVDNVQLVGLPFPQPAQPGVVVDDANDMAQATYILAPDLRLDVQMKVLAQPPTGPYPEDVRITYTFTNTGTGPLEVGLRHLMDLDIQQYAVQLVVNGQLQAYEREWVGPAVPDSYHMIDNTTLSQIEMVGQMRGEGLTTPDRFVTAFMSDIVGSPWDFVADGTPLRPQEGAPFQDQSVALYWNPRTIQPGQSLSISTAYGFIATTDITCPLIQDGICLPESGVPPQDPPTIFDDDPLAFHFVTVLPNNVTPNVIIITNTGDVDTRQEGFLDQDGDGILDEVDNCVYRANPDQADQDGDGIGDVCDGDRDSDGISDDVDNCPTVPNPDQSDIDGDGQGDACDDDDDNDGVPDTVDNCPNTPNPDQADLDGDGVGDVCENDRDGDGVLDEVDNCPFDFNPDQSDIDGDGIGDQCDLDADDDGIPNTVDNCPVVPNPDQSDVDGDGLGDACDPDIDGDGIPNIIDPSPLLLGDPNRLPIDFDFTYGAAMADVDNDGDLDIVTANGLVSAQNPTALLNRLYLNDGNGFFTDATFGPDGRPGTKDDRLPFILDASYSVKFADFDNDGDMDIVVFNFATQNRDFGAQNRIYINIDVDDPTINPLYDSDSIGDGFFVDRTQEMMPGLLNIGPFNPPFDYSTHGDVGDIDGDGDIDIIVSNLSLFTDPVGTSLEIIVDQASYISKTTTAGPDTSDPVLFNNRVLINNRSQSAVPFGTPDAPISFRDDTLGADNRFGGDVVDPTYLDRLPFVYPDIHQRNPTTNPAAPFEEQNGLSFQAILAPMVSDYSLDLVVINYRGAGVPASFILDGQDMFYANLDINDDGIADGYFSCYNFGSDNVWDVDSQIPELADYQGSTFLIGVPDGSPGDNTSPIEVNLVSLAPTAQTSGVIFDTNNDGFNEVISASQVGGEIDLYDPINEGALSVPAALRALTGNVVGGYGSIDLWYDGAPDLPLGDTFPRNRNAMDYDIIDGRVPAAQGGARFVTYADFDRDGNPDLFVANQPLTGSVTQPRPNNLYKNNSFGSFVDISAGDLKPNDPLESMVAVAGDVDNDGDIDLFVGNWGQPNQIYINQLYSPSRPARLDDPVDPPIFYDMTGQAKGLLSSPGFTLNAAFADIDNDGDLDMAFTNGALLTISGANTFVLKNVGEPLNQGTYSLVASGTSFPAPRISQFPIGFNVSDINLYSNLPGYDIDFADFDNDGDNDLFVTYYSIGNRIYMNHDSNDPLINSMPDTDSIGDGHFVNETIDRLPLFTNLTYEFSKKFAIGDVNNDGLLDIVIANGIPNSGAPNVLLLNSKAGPFNKPGYFIDGTARLPIVTYSDGQQGPVFDDTIEPVLADFTGDGWLDIIFLNRKADDPNVNPDMVQHSRFLRNRGLDNLGNWIGFEEDDTFIAPLSGIVAQWEALVVADFDNAGDPTEDVNGNGRVDPTEVEFIRKDGKVDFVDRNANGRFDASWDVICVRTDGPALLLLNAGNTALSDDNSFERVPQTENLSYGVTAGDVDQDGDQDIIIANHTAATAPSLQMWENTGVGSAFFIDRPNEIPNPTSIKFAGGVLDYNNNSRSPVLADIDGDTDLDLYVCNLGDENFSITNPQGSVNYLYFNRRVGASWRLRDKFPVRVPGGGGPLIVMAQPGAAPVGASFVKVKIYGRNFSPGAGVSFGSGIALSHAPIIRNSTEMDVVIHIKSTASPGPRQIIVTNPDGQVAIGRPGIFYVLSTDSPSAEVTLGAEPVWANYE